MRCWAHLPRTARTSSFTQVRHPSHPRRMRRRAARVAQAIHQLPVVRAPHLFGDRLQRGPVRAQQPTVDKSCWAALEAGRRAVAYVVAALLCVVDGTVWTQERQGCLAAVVVGAREIALEELGRRADVGLHGLRGGLEGSAGSVRQSLELRVGGVDVVGDATQQQQVDQLHLFTGRHNHP
jgi:hypothetical protein